MSFFGMSQAGKDANGNTQAMANWNFGQYKDWLGRGNDAYDKGTALTNEYENFQRARTQNGFTPIDQIQGYGAQIMPGLDEAIAAGNQRLQDIATNYNNLPGKAYDTMATIRDNSGKQGQMIGQNYDDQQGEINSTYGRNAGRYAGANDAIQGDIAGRYGALEHNVNQGYGDLRGENASVYGNLGNQAGQDFATMQQNLEQLRPGSQFQQAEVARSYAPMISNAMTRLRRSGANPDSLQAQSVMQSAERQRARGMDEAAARGTEGYVNSKNALSMAQLQNRQGLSQSQLGNDLNLGTQQLGKTTDLGREQGNLYRGQVAANADQQSQLDAARQAQSMQNNDQYFNRTANWYDKANQNALLDRNLNLQDWQTGSDLAREQNANDVNNIGLRDQRYQRGLQYAANDLSERNAGSQNIGDLAGRQQNYALASGGLARGFGGDATQDWNTVYNREAQNAGWGTKMLAGIAGGALNMVAPGAGNLLTGAVNGAYGGGQQQQQQGGAGWNQQGGWAAGTPPFAPSNNSNANAYNTQPTNWFGSVMNYFKQPRSGGAVNGGGDVLGTLN